MADVAAKRAQLQYVLLTTLRAQLESLHQLGTFDTDPLSDHIEVRTRQAIQPYINTGKAHDGSHSKATSMYRALRSLDKELTTAWDTSPEPAGSGTKRQLAGLLLSSVRSLKLVLNSKTTEAEIAAQWHRFVSGVSGLGAFHTDMWDDAIDVGLPLMLEENLRNGAMVTQPLDTPLGSTMSILFLDAVVGLQSGKARHIYSKVLSEKLTALHKLVAAEEVVSADLVSRFSDTEATPTEQIHRLEAHRAVAKVKDAVERMQARWVAARDAFDDAEKEVCANARLLTTGTTSEIRKKYRVPSRATDAEAYEVMSKHIGELWGSVARVGNAIADDMIIEAADYLAPVRHVRARLTYDEPMYIQIAYRFQVPTDNGLFRQVDIRSHTDTTEDTNGVAFPLGLTRSCNYFWYKAGDVPTIVMGRRCVLRRMKELGVPLGSIFESPSEYGGHFIINGTEKILRVLTTPRTNIPIRLRRGHFQRNGKNFSDKAIMFRSKVPSGRCIATYFHYVNNGEILMSFAKKYVNYIPVMMILLALKDTTLYGVLTCLSTGIHDRAALSRVEAFIQHHGTKPYSDVVGQEGMVAVLGRLFKELQLQRKVSPSFLPECTIGHGVPQHSDIWYGRYLLRKYLFPHLNCAVSFEGDLVEGADPEACRALQGERDRKYELLLHVVRSLHGFVDGTLEEEVVDRPSHQEVFSLRNMFVGVADDCILRAMKQTGLRIYSSLSARITSMVMEVSPSRPLVDKELLTIFRPETNTSVLAPLMRIFSTGSYNPDSDLGMPVPQLVGLCIVCERMNIFRIVELLRGVHRGRHILEMRSSEVRRCAPESWGFYCVVNTPDGEACGVQNQLTLSAYVTTGVGVDVGATVQRVLAGVMLPAQNLPAADRFLMAPVIVDGAILGYVPSHSVATAGAFLQSHKMSEITLSNVEVVAIPGSRGTLPIIHVFASQGRLMRPVREMPSGRILNIGTWEQTYMDIACVYVDFQESRTEQGKFGFVEPNCANLLSLTAAVIPFFEHNCSPRNLFQCGITKQSVGPPLFAAVHRHDTKLYHQPYVQKCVVRTSTMDEYDLDESTVNVNAVLGVASYTGLDMEDALVLNASAVQRGMFGVYQTLCKEISAEDKGHYKKTNADHLTSGTKITTKAVFHNLLKPGVRKERTLSISGLPLARRTISDVMADPSRHHGKPSHTDDTPLYVVAQKITIEYEDGRKTVEYSQHQVKTWRELDKGECGSIHCVVPTAFDGPDPTTVFIFLRLQRDPVIGDKFCSRHGQKGTVGLLMPQVDVPFSASGVIPDVIINPHAFPSRMAVGMILELLAGKFAALEGVFMDGSPWTVVDDKPVSAKLIGDLLVKHGMRPCGAETLYNGFTGEPMDVDLFVGLGGYQRLRHMVKDKWQVRARTDGVRTRVETGTGQPVHGRKLHGGVRVGEMERDALISHGAAEVVIDRLLNVSDRTRAYICGSCGGMLCFRELSETGNNTYKVCYFCKAETVNDDGSRVEGKIHLIDVPQVLRLMVAEMAGVGIRTCITVRDPAEQ